MKGRKNKDGTVSVRKRVGNKRITIREESSLQRKEGGTPPSRR